MQSFRQLIGRLMRNIYVQTAGIQLFTLIVLLMIWISAHSPA